MSMVENNVDNNEKKQGEMAIFISSKGGVGKTTMAVNVAAVLASRGFSTCIMDGSFQFGDVNLAFDIQPRYTISDMVQREEALEDIKISDFLYKHDCGLKILSAPLKPEFADLVTAQMIPRICEKLLENNEYLIVDLTTGISEINLNFIELADLIFLVTDLELAALKNTKMMLRTIKKLNMADKIRIVVNRSDTETLTKASHVPDMLETEDIIYISNDFKVVSKSFNVGIPFVISKPKEKITQEVVSLTREFNKCNFGVKRRAKKKKVLMGFFKI